MPIVGALFVLGLHVHTSAWPPPRALQDCITSTLDPACQVHVVGTIARRRLLGKKLAFADLQDDGGDRSELQILIRAGDHPIARHKLMPGGQLAVLGKLRLDAATAKPTLVAEATKLIRAAPCDNAVDALLAAVRAGRASEQDALEALSSSNTTVEDRSAISQLLQPALSDSALRKLRGALVRRLQSSSTPRAVKIAASGGGHAHTGLQNARHAPNLAFLYESNGCDGLGAAALATAAGARQGLAGVAAAQLGADAPLSTADALSRQTEHCSESGGAPPIIVVEGEVGRRQRLQDDLDKASQMVLLGLTDAEHCQHASAGVAAAECRDRAALDGAQSKLRLLRCLLHPAFCQACDAPAAARFALDAERLAAFSKLAAQGARIRVAGHWAPQSDAATDPVLIVLAIRLVRCTAVLRVVQAAIDALADGILTDGEAAQALRTVTSTSGREQRVVTRAAIAAKSKAERAWLAAEIAAELQREQPAPQLGRRIGLSDRAMVERLAPMRVRYPLLSAENAAVSANVTRATAPRRVSTMPTLLPHDLPSAARKQTGAMNEWQTRPSGEPQPWQLRAGLDGSYWSRKKRPQLLFMTEQVHRLLCAHPAWGTRALHILDIGGGKGLLAEHLARVYGERVRVTLVEIEPKRLRQARARMSGSMPANLHLVEGDASKLSALGKMEGIDFATGLHACGGLTDLIISHAVQQGAGFAVCSCCFNSNKRLPLPHGCSRNSWLAGPGDARVSADEVSALMRVAEISGDPDAACASAHTVNALRAAAAEDLWADTWRGRSALRPSHLDVEIVEYAARFSARNLCIVGHPRWRAETQAP